jgi:hypothetical protein
MRWPFVSRLAFEIQGEQLQASYLWADKMEAQIAKLTDTNVGLVDRILEMKSQGYEKVNTPLVHQAQADEFGPMTEVAIEENAAGDRALEDHLRTQARALLTYEYDDQEIAQAISQGAVD